MPHVAGLLRVARRLTLDPAAAEDLVQETMLLAWRGFRGFERGTNARAWLFRILFNVFHGRARRARYSPEAGAGIIRPMLQEAAEIAQALDALSTEQRAVLLVCVVEGFSCREAAGILDLPIGTVMSRLARAREHLKKMLEPMAKAAYK